MKKRITITMVFLGMLFQIHSQTMINSSIDITGGYTPDGYAANANFNLVIDPSYIKLGIYFSNSKSIKNQYEIPYTIFTINGGYFMPVFQNKKQNLSFDVGLGVLAGYEVVNNGNNELSNGAIIDSDSNFIYGGFGTAEIEYGISRKLWILAKATEYYHLNSDLGSATLYAGFGFRLYLN